MKRKIKNVIVFIVLFISSILIVGSSYYTKAYPEQDFDVILYSAFNGLEHTAPDVINKIIETCIIPVVLLTIVLAALTIKDSKNQITMYIKTKKREIKKRIFPINIIANHRIIYILFVLIVANIICIRSFGIDEFIKNRLSKTYIFDDYYIDPQSVQIEFPEKKKNLIIIIGESFENTLFTEENGGVWEYSIMPELEKLALDNISFSNTEKIGGAYQTYGADYSAGGNVAITAGIPLKTVDYLQDKNVYTGNGQYLDGAYTLGEILRDNGYNLEIMMGSDGTFGGRLQYYKTNGNYKIFDLNYAIENGKMKKDEKVWWGFEDDRLFKWSKEEILELAKDDKPFNYIMLTADTHFVDGYLSTNAKQKYDSQYENVHAYASELIYEFVQWAQKQDFYKDTTIVIVGDHLGMQNDFYEQNIKGDYERTVYNVFINSSLEAQNNQNRKFTTMDLFPTILASIGVKIEGERLGLGTNLYSGIPTLVEELGYDNYNNEIKKTSVFYNKVILGNDYYEMKKYKEEKNEDNTVK